MVAAVSKSPPRFLWQFSCQMDNEKTSNCTTTQTPVLGEFCAGSVARQFSASWSP